MDFSKFDIRTAAETARPLHVRDPITGEPIMDGDKPCRVMVIGTSSREAQARIKDAARALMLEKSETPDESRTLGDIHDDSVRAAARLIVGFENINRGDVLAKVPDDCTWFLQLTFFNAQRREDGKLAQPSFSQQIIEFAADDSGFLKAASKP